MSIILSCTSIDKNSVIKSQKHNCSDIFEERAKAENYKIHKKIVEGASHLVSYTFSGVGFMADSIVFLSTGVASPVVICSPLYPIAGRAARGLEVIIRCWAYIGGEVYGAVSKFLGGSLGKKVYKSTQKMRCPDVKWFKETLNEIAVCYKNNGDLDKYKSQLKVINTNSLLTSCSDD